MDIKHGWTSPFFCLDTKHILTWNKMEDGIPLGQFIPKLNCNISCHVHPWPLITALLSSWPLKKKTSLSNHFNGSVNCSFKHLLPVWTGWQAKRCWVLESLLSNRMCLKHVKSVFLFQSAWLMISAEARRREFLFSRFCFSLRSTGALPLSPAHAQLSAAGSHSEASKERI